MNKNKNADFFMLEMGVDSVHAAADALLEEYNREWPITFKELEKFARKHSKDVKDFTHIDASPEKHEVSFFRYDKYREEPVYEEPGFYCENENIKWKLYLEAVDTIKRDIRRETGKTLDRIDGNAIIAMGHYKVFIDPPEILVQAVNNKDPLNSIDITNREIFSTLKQYLREYIRVQTYLRIEKSQQILNLKYFKYSRNRLKFE